MAKTPMTTAAPELLRAELQRLKAVERPNVITAIADARAHGDLSENAEYDAARNRQGFIEGRISEIEPKLANAQVVDPRLLDADGRCVFGATVVLAENGHGPDHLPDRRRRRGEHQGREASRSVHRSPAH